MFQSLKPFHLFLFATVFLLLVRTSNGNVIFELVCLFIALILYIIALVKSLKQKK